MNCRYFDDDDEPQTAASSGLEYIPAPDSPTSKQPVDDSSEEEEDPLDAFMANLEKKSKDDDKKKTISSAKGIRDDIEQEDDEESYYRYLFFYLFYIVVLMNLKLTSHSNRYMEENPLAGTYQDSSDPELDYDEDGNPIAPPKKKFIDPLPPIDHSEIEYEPFEKNFYNLHEDIQNLSEEQVYDLKKNLGIKVITFHLDVFFIFLLKSHFK